MSRRLPTADIVMLIALVLCVFGSLAGIEFYSRGEGREALNGQGVLLGNWLVPRGYGGGIASKPPLLHWLIAAVSLPTGTVTSFTARIPSFLSAMLLAWGIYRFAPPSRRWIVILVLGSSFEWVRAAVSCRVDMVHAATLAGALALWPSLRSASGKGGRLIVGGAALTAASVLAKGPVALVISSVVFLAWYWLEERHHGVPWARFFGNAAKWLGLASVMAGLWYGVALVLGGEEFRRIFWSENIGRFTGTMESVPHEHGVLYLAAVLVVGLLPWSIVVPLLAFRRRGMRVAFRGLVQQVQSRGFRWGLTRGIATLRTRFSGLPAIDRYALLVGAVIFLFYCIPGSKRGVYLLAGYPFYAIVLGRYLERLVATGSAVRLQRFFSGMVIALASVLTICSVVGVVGGRLSFGGSPAWVSKALNLLAEMGVGSGYGLSWMALGAAFAYGITTWRRAGDTLALAHVAVGGQEEVLARQLRRAAVGENHRAVIRCLTCAVAMILMIQANIQAPVSRYWSEYPIGEKLRELVPTDARLVSWHREFYGASLYAERTIVPVEGTPAAGDYCLLRAVDLPVLRTELPQPLQPIFISQIVRGFGGSDTVLLVRIESPGAGLGSV